MTNKFEILNNTTTNATSPAFKVNLRDAIGVNDTEYSAYFELQGVLGGAVLSWQKLCQPVGGGAATYLEILDDSVSLNTNFPATAGCILMSLGIKFNDSMQLVVSGVSGTTNITITGINISAA